MANEELHSGSPASVYQPPTSDPQSNINGNLQPGAGNLQPTGQQSDNPNQSFPDIGQLKVVTAESPGTTIGPPAIPNNLSNQGLSKGAELTIVVLIFILILGMWLIMPKLAREVEAPKATKLNKSKSKKKK